MKQTDNLKKIPNFVESNIKIGLKQGLIWAVVKNADSPYEVRDYDQLIDLLNQSFNSEIEKPIIQINYQRPHTQHDFKWEELVVMAEYVNLIANLGYSPENIDFETTSSLSKSKKRADIVVYTNSKDRKSYILVECKQSYRELNAAKTQVMEYATTRQANYVLVSSGDVRKFADVSKYNEQENPFPEIPNLPNADGLVAEEIYYKNSDKGLSRKTISEEEFRKRLRTIVAMFKDNGFTPNDRYKLTGKLLFCSILEDKTLQRDEAYAFQANNRNNLSHFYRKINSLYINLRKNYNNQMEAGLISENQADFLFNIVKELHDIDLNKSDFDWGYVYHVEMYPKASKKDKDANFTPQKLIKLGYQIIQPEANDKFADICAGYCPFLIGSKDYFKEQNYEEYPAVFGDKAVCFDTSLDVVPTAVINLLSKKFSGNQIIRTNSACSEKEFCQKTGIQPDSIDCIISNPPFSLDVLEPIVKNKINISRPGKTMGLIMPGDFFSLKKYKNLRNFLFNTCKIRSIMMLYKRIFQDTTIKTIYLFYEKKVNQEEINVDYDIFLADLKTDVDIENVAKIYHDFKAGRIL